MNTLTRWLNEWVKTIRNAILLYGACCALSLVPVAYSSALSLYAAVTGMALFESSAASDYRSVLEEREAIARSEAEPYTLPDKRKGVRITKP